MTEKIIIAIIIFTLSVMTYCFFVTNKNCAESGGIYIKTVFVYECVYGLRKQK